ncbi:hypothetical protein [Streptomyces sp. NPDC002763]|uniref:hypothetical protein n=1 Tax=Streptomyces sp. NPDC002763 TaxID=3154427 RepID=UPI00331D84C9
MGDDDRRQDSAGKNGIVISGGNAQVNSSAGHTYQFTHHVTQPASFQSDANEQLEMIAYLTHMVERHQTDLLHPDLAVEALLRMREEFGRPHPEPALVRQFLEQLEASVQPVPSLGTVVRELARTLRRVFETADTGLERTQTPAARSPEPETAPLPITMYLSDEAAHADVQAAVEALLATAGLVVLDREDPVTGSWFRRMRATMSRTARSQAVRDGALTAAHIADARLVLAQDATITATMMQNVGPLLTSLQPTKDAVVRIGAILIVKVDWKVQVLQLTAAQQAILDHRPQLATSPHDVIGAIGLLGASSDRTTADSATRTAADR